jgi:hypothetical protein
MQSKIGSLIETLINIGTGFLISMMINIWILPQVGCQVTAGQNVFMVTVFTVASVIRSYVFRRVFNAWTIRNISRQPG